MTENLKKAWDLVNEGNCIPNMIHDSDGVKIRVPNHLKNYNKGDMVMLRDGTAGIACSESTWRDDYIWIRLLEDDDG